MESQEVVKELKKNGCVEYHATIKNITITVMEEWVRLGITLNKNVPGYQQDENGAWEKGETNVIFTSTYSIGSLIKENDEAAFAANHLIENPTALKVILSRAEITILQEAVATGQSYKNPFSENAEPVVFDHDTIINHIVDIKMSEFGNKMLETLAIKMLGI